MPFINAALGDAKEASAVPDGTYHLRIVKKEDTKTKGREGKAVRDMTKITIRIEDQDYPNASLVNYYMVYPVAGDDANTRNMMLLNIKRFLSVFEIPFEDGGFNTDDLTGAEGECLLGQRVVEPEDGPSYVTNELILPRLQEE